MPISRSRLIEEELGASLVEVLIAIAISGLLLGAIGMAVPRFMIDASLSTAEGRIRAIAHRGRMRALAEQRPIRLTISGERIGLSPPLNKDDAVGTGRTDITIVSGLREGSAAVVVFRPDGSSSGAQIDLKDPRAARRLEIDWATGRVLSHAR